MSVANASAAHVTMATPNDETARSHFMELRRSLQALASPASEQLRLFPESAANADALASDFQHWASVVRGNYASELSRSQSDALAAIEQKLSMMSRDGAEFDLELWTEPALNSSAQWEELRRLATEALEALQEPR